jgi:hypothetical protein
VIAMSETRTDASAVIEVLKELHGIAVLDEESIPDQLAGELVALPKGMHLIDLRPYLNERLEAPRRTKGYAKHTTLASFIDAANRFKTTELMGEGVEKGSVVFAVDDMSAPRLLCVVDYHGHRDPRFCEHLIEYAFPLSDEWKAWSAAFASKGMSQAEFATFLEDRITDVIEVGAVGERGQKMAESLGLSLAGSGSILGLSRGISIKAETRVNSLVNLSTGEGKILFEEKHGDEAGGSVKVPGGFVIGIPVVRGGPLFQVFVRIRYRLSGGAVIWSFTPHRIDAVFRAAFEEACAEVREKTALPLFYGTPER